jgi:hypothetical protein
MVAPAISPLGQLTAEDVRTLVRWVLRTLGTPPPGAVVYQVKVTQTEGTARTSITEDAGGISADAIADLLGAVRVQESSRLVVAWLGAKDERSRHTTLTGSPASTRSILRILAASAIPSEPPVVAPAILAPSGDDSMMAGILAEVDRAANKGELMPASMVRVILFSVLGMLHYSEKAAAQRVTAIEKMGDRALSLAEGLSTELRTLAVRNGSTEVYGAMMEAGIAIGEKRQLDVDLPKMQTPAPPSERLQLVERLLTTFGPAVASAVLAPKPRQLTTSTPSTGAALKPSDDGSHLLAALRNADLPPSAVSAVLLLTIEEEHHPRLGAICREVLSTLEK